MYSLTHSGCVLLFAAGVSFAAVQKPVQKADQNGMHLEDQYVQVPFASPSAGDTICDHLNPSRGTIEFWMRPDFDWLDSKTHHLFFWGRRDNAKSIFICKTTRRLYFFLCGRKRIGASMRLRREDHGLAPGTWHHIACCWDTTCGKIQRQLFLDGRCADSTQIDDRPDRQFGGIPKIPVNMYIGTGKANARLLTDVSPQLTVAQFRISDIVRYDAEFRPAHEFTVDTHTLLYLPFTDGSVAGKYYRDGLAPGEVKAVRVDVQGQEEAPVSGPASADGGKVEGQGVDVGRRAAKATEPMPLAAAEGTRKVPQADTESREALATGPLPLTADDDTMFLAHYDGGTRIDGLAADFSVRVPTPSERGGDCRISPGGRFGNALRLTPTSYMQYALTDVDLTSYTIETWFRMDSDHCAWRMPATEIGKYGILQLVAPEKPYDRVMIEVHYHSLKVTHTSGGEAKSKRFYSFGIGKGGWLAGSEHHLAVTFDGSRAGQTSLLVAYVDGQKIWEERALRPLQAKNFNLILGQKPSPDAGYRKYKALAGQFDELRISNRAHRRVLDLSRPQWRGFLPGPYDRCRPQLPLELYFSKPLDPKHGPPVRLVDRTTDTTVAFSGQYLGNGSVYQLTCASPLPFGHEFSLAFEVGGRQARDAVGNRIDVASIPLQQFRTRNKGDAPRLLPLKFRNDNTHVTAEGMERMCEYMDAIEFSMARIKDGWVTNHLTNWRVVPAIGGDEKAFQSMPKPAPDTSYAELAQIDFFNVDDGKIDPIPRCRELYEIIRKWDKVVHLQIKFSKQMAASEQKKLLDTWLEEVQFDWSRFHSWHKAKEGVLPNERNSTYALAYPDRGERNARFYYPNERGWPGFTTPEWVNQAEAHGRTTWGSQLTTKPGIQRLARLGMDYMLSDDLAYKGKQLPRQALFELHMYEGAAPPVVRTATTADGEALAGATVPAKPVIRITFNTQVEARSFNYRSVRLSRNGGQDAGLIPMRIDAAEEWTSFVVSPQMPLPAGPYVLEVGGGAAPVSVAGLVQSEKFRATFTAGE